jgi:hypothetical protein
MFDFDRTKKIQKNKKKEYEKNPGKWPVAIA